MKRSTKMKILIIVTVVIAIAVSIMLFCVFSEKSTSNQDVNNDDNNGTQQQDSTGRDRVPTPTPENPLEEVLPAGGIRFEDLSPNREDLTPIEGNDEYSEFSEWFVNKRGIEFVFRRGTERLSNISAPRPDTMPDESVLSIEKMKENALIILGYFTDESNYVVRQAGTDSDMFFLHRIVNGYRSDELAVISFFRSGAVSGITLMDTGLFDNAYVPLINEAEFDEKFHIAVRERFNGGEGMSFRITSRTIGYRAGEIVMNYGFVYRYDHEDEYDYRSYMDGVGINVPIPGAVMRS